MSGSNGSVGYIDDGYTRDETIPACEWHPALSVRFRPFTYGEKRAVQQRVDFLMRNAVTDSDVQKGVDAGEKLVAEAVAKHVVEWDLRDAAGNIIGVDAKAIQRLEPHLSAKLFNLVTGEVRSFQPAQDPKGEDDSKN